MDGIGRMEDEAVTHLVSSSRPTRIKALGILKLDRIKRRIESVYVVQLPPSLCIRELFLRLNGVESPCPKKPTSQETQGQDPIFRRQRDTNAVSTYSSVGSS